MINSRPIELPWRSFFGNQHSVTPTTPKPLILSSSVGKGGKKVRNECLDCITFGSLSITSLTIREQRTTCFESFGGGTLVVRPTACEKDLQTRKPYHATTAVKVKSFLVTIMLCVVSGEWWVVNSDRIISMRQSCRNFAIPGRCQNVKTSSPNKHAFYYGCWGNEILEWLEHRVSSGNRMDCCCLSSKDIEEEKSEIESIKRIESGQE